MKTRASLAISRIGVRLLVACVAVSAAGVASAAQEEAWPQRPVTLVVPFAPGGASDFVARIIQVPLSEELKQPIVIENRAGAAGNVGMQFAARAAPDGYTVYLGNIGTTAINPSIFGAQLKVHPAEDFIAVNKVVDVADILVANNDVPVKTVKDFVAYAKARDGKLNFATPGAGSLTRLEMEVFMKLNGLNMVHVPYKGGAGPAVTDVIGGQCEVMFVSLPSAIQFVKAGRLRALGVTIPNRWPALPAVPTFLEAGYKDLVATEWQGIFVPRGTPAPIVARLFAVSRKVMARPDVAEKLAMGGVLPSTSGSPEEFAAFLRSESARWGALVKERGISAQ